MLLQDIFENKSSYQDSIIENSNLITFINDDETQPEIKLDASANAGDASKTYLIYVGTVLYILLEYIKGGSTIGYTSSYNISKLLDGKIDTMLYRNTKSIQSALIDIGISKARAKLKKIPKGVLSKFKSK